MSGDRSNAQIWRRLSVWRRTCLFTGIFTLLASALASAESSDAIFEQRVRSYILSNPEVILEALEVLSQREARAAMTAKIEKYPDLFTEPAVLGLGPKNARLTVVEFFDYRCGPCKAIHPELKAALEAHPDIRLEMRHLPILSPGSERGARFALAVKNVAGAEKYADVHKDIWALTGPLREAAFQKIAESHSLEWSAIQNEMESDVVSARIARNRDIAIDLEILGTPAFVTPVSVTFGQSDVSLLIQGWLNQ